LFLINGTCPQQNAFIVRSLCYIHSGEKGYTT